MRLLNMKKVMTFIIILLILFPTLPGVFSWGASTLIPTFSNTLTNIAVTSLMVISPEGAIKMLEERFSYHIDKMPPSSSEEASVEEEIEYEDEDAMQSEVIQENDVESNSGDTALEDVQASSNTKEELVNRSVQPDIPDEYVGELVGENFSGNVSSNAEEFDGVYIRNSTDLTTDELNSILEEPLTLGIRSDITAPQVLIYHTHGTESFAKYDSAVYDMRNTWRTTDNNDNVVAVGEVMVNTLEENGISVVQSRTHHDYPSYTGSYSRSAVTIADYLEEYPSIKIIIDVHRDALEREGNVIVKPITQLDGNKYAQIMLMVCRSEENPNWQNNLRLATQISEVLAMNIPEINRPIYFTDGSYNQGLAENALLVEMGSHANTIEESMRSAEELGLAISKVLKYYMDTE